MDGTMILRVMSGDSRCTRRGTRGVAVTLLMLSALTSAQCRQVDRSLSDGGETLTIHIADGDERVLGPLGAYPWFLVFLGIADYPEGAGDGPIVDAVPELLNRWQHSEDYSQWTLHVREDVKWGDGTPVTAEDVKFSLELWTRPDVGYDVRLFETITVLDPHTLHVVFKRPVAGTIFQYNWLAVVPEHLLGELAIEELFRWPFWITPVGNGPYRYSRHIPGTMTELVANPDYYGEPPRIRTVVLRYGGNPLTELLSGNVDIATGLRPIDAMQVRTDDRFQVDQTYGSGATWVIVWNHRNPLFADARVRRALTLAVDRRELFRVLQLPEDMPIVDVPTRARHRRQGLSPPPLPYDPDGAKELLAEVGWVDADEDGTLERDDQEFQFTFIVDEQQSTYAILLQEQFRRIGIRMEIASFDRTTWRQRARAGDFDATLWLYSYIENFGGTDIFTGYSNAEITALRDSAWHTIDPELHDRHMRAMWRLFAQEIPVTYLHPPVFYRAAHRRVKGLETDIDFIRDIEHLWIEDR